MRLQLALNVPDLEAAIGFYSGLFGVDVAKRKPGYANFEIEQPALKLVLFESCDTSDRLNHVGVEVFDDAAVASAAARMTSAGLAVHTDAEEKCCFARQNKAITHAPDGTMWEWYHKLEDLSDFAAADAADASAAPAPRACC